MGVLQEKKTRNVRARAPSKKAAVAASAALAASAAAEVKQTEKERRRGKQGKARQANEISARHEPAPCSTPLLYLLFSFFFPFSCFARTTTTLRCRQLQRLRSSPKRVLRRAKMSLIAIRHALPICYSRSAIWLVGERERRGKEGELRGLRRARWSG
jgi:hypothetical protein